MNTLAESFGNMDIYLFDQLLKGNIQSHHKILDAGCGNGRNLFYFLKNHFQICAVDQNPEAVQRVKALSAEIAPDYSLNNFYTANITAMPFEEETFDVVICNAVLHFARDEHHFGEMLDGMWRVLKPGGLLFSRLASDTGIEAKVIPLGNGRFLLPDGSERYLVSEAQLLDQTSRRKGRLSEYIKTTNVQGLRCMTTWCMRKGEG